MSTQAQSQTEPKLLNAWKRRCKSIAESNKLNAEGHRVSAEADQMKIKNYEFFECGTGYNEKGDTPSAEACKLVTECDKRYAEGSKLFAEAMMLQYEAEMAWLDAITNAYGEKIFVKWNIRNDLDKNESPASDCILSNGDVYTFEMGKPTPVNPKLLEAWKRFTKLHDESIKLHAEASKLHNESCKLIAENSKQISRYYQINAESKKRHCDAEVLYSKGYSDWVNAVIEVHGDITMVWIDREEKGIKCILGNDETYTVEMDRE